MSSNQVTSTDPSVVAQQTRSTTNTATLAYTQLVSTLAQAQTDPSSVSQQDLSLLASTVSNAATNLQQAMSGMSSQLQAGGNSSTLQAAYKQASDLLGDLGANVGRLNNALYTGGSTLRLSGSPTAGYSASKVNLPAEGGAGTSASTSSLVSQGIGQNDPGTGVSANTNAVQALQGTPIGDILTAVVQGLVSQVQSGKLNPLTGETSGSSSNSASTSTAEASTADATTSTSSGFNQTQYERNAARNTESGGVAPNPLLTSFLSALDNYLKQQNGQNGGSSNTKSSGKGKSATHGGSSAGVGGTGSQDSSGAQQGGGVTGAQQATSGSGGPQQATSGSGGTGSQNAGSGGNGATAGNGTQNTRSATAGTGGGGTTSQSATQGAGGTTNQSATRAATGGGGDTNSATDGPFETNTTGIGEGSGVDTSGVLGNPLMGAANINGYIMAVLLECYKSGQQDLLTEAQNLQALNRAKDGVRAQLASARKANSSQNDPGGGNSEQVQDLEDQLTSMGDDAQLEQLNLQNLAQNQQQLLQMLSNFMKNTHDDSMAIIRHIGGG